MYNVKIGVSLPRQGYSHADLVTRVPLLDSCHGWWDPEECSQTCPYWVELGVPVVRRLGAWRCR